MVALSSDVLREKALLLVELCGGELGQTEVSEKVAKLLKKLESPFTITVFGEVNAGKSSFINALLGIPDLCRTDVDVCTDRITILRYCPQREVRRLDEAVEEVCVDEPLLRGFVVVDTPGINSVLEYHELITGKFLPESDAVLVVLSAVNPHSRTLWDWVGRVAERFGDRLVFVLQQSDLVSDPASLRKLIERVRSYAKEKGVAKPAVFAVSALKELKGENGNFEPLRRYLNEHFTGERQLKAKLEGVRFELARLYSECVQRVDRLKEELNRQLFKLEEVRLFVENRKKEVEHFKDLLLQSIDNRVDRLRKKVLNRLREVSFFDYLFRKKKVESFLEELRKEIQRDLEEFGKDELKPKLELFENGLLRPTVEEAAKRMMEFEVLLRKTGWRGSLDGNYRRVLEYFRKEKDGLKVPSREKALGIISVGVLTGSIFAFLSGSALVDVTGGVISALSLISGTFYLKRQRRKFEKKLEEVFATELGQKLKAETVKALDEATQKTLGVMAAYLEKRIEVARRELERLEALKNRLLAAERDLRRLEATPSRESKSS
ncbi:MAG: hypothetical protein GXO08_04220 [Aquificae bacterium]|nr:hypothetical protein [Aquificota bacterium]